MANENEVVITGKFDDADIKRGVESTEDFLARLKGEVDSTFDEVADNAEEVSKHIEQLRDTLINLGGSFLGIRDAPGTIKEIVSVLGEFGVTTAAMTGVGVVIAGVTQLWSEHKKAIKDADDAFAEYIKRYPNSEMARGAAAAQAVQSHEQLGRADEGSAKNQDEVWRAGRAARGLQEEYLFGEKLASVMTLGIFSLAEWEKSMKAGAEAIANTKNQHEDDRQLAERNAAAAAEAKAIAQQDAEMDRGQQRLDANQSKEDMRRYLAEKAEEERRAAERAADMRKLAGLEDHEAKLAETEDRQAQLKAVADEFKPSEKNFQSRVESFDATYNRIAAAAASGKEDPGEKDREQRKLIAEKQDQMRAIWREEEKAERAEIIRILKEKLERGLR